MCTKYPEPGADGRCRLLSLSASRGRHNCVLIWMHQDNYCILWCLRSQMFFPTAHNMQYTVVYLKKGKKKIGAAFRNEINRRILFQLLLIYFGPKTLPWKSRRKTLSAYQLIDCAWCNRNTFWALRWLCSLNLRNSCILSHICKFSWLFWFLTEQQKNHCHSAVDLKKLGRTDPLTDIRQHLKQLVVISASNSFQMQQNSHTSIQKGGSSSHKA